eukprot:3239353-Prymnesium_polylepis.1
MRPSSVPRQHLESTSVRYTTMEVCGATLTGVRRLHACAPRVSQARCVASLKHQIVAAEAGRSSAKAAPISVDP